MSDQRAGGIAWTDETWNPIRGCSRVSKGCTNCYAERMGARLSGPGRPYDGLIRIGPNGPRWTGKLRMVPERLGDPLRWTRPRMVFVNSMSDLFHERLSNQDIAAVFGVMAASPRHIFQVLTKRSHRMRAWFEWLANERNDDGSYPLQVDLLASMLRQCGIDARAPSFDWPLPNVWLGVSVEDQDAADVRLPDLMETPAAVRWVSYEPALGPIDFRRRNWFPGLDWGVVGGESGPGARSFQLEWARSFIRQFFDGGAAPFVKQLGSRPVDGGNPESYGGGLIKLRHPKGGDESEWPADLRYRQWPKAMNAWRGTT